MMVAAAIFGMSLLIAYAANNMKAARDAKVAAPPVATVNAANTPATVDSAAKEEEPEVELNDEDLGDFGKPVIDLDGEEADAGTNIEDAADAEATAEEEAAAAGDTAAAAAAQAGLAARNVSE